MDNKVEIDVEGFATKQQVYKIVVCCGKHEPRVCVAMAWDFLLAEEIRKTVENYFCKEYKVVLKDEEEDPSE